jgi:CRP/FNR family cyclic AMP-dependent transcriptional regulator
MCSMEWRLLQALPEDGRRAVLAAARRRRFRRGEVVFHEGDPGDTLHLVTRGHVAVRVTTPLGDCATVAVLGPESCFGELALLTPAPRSATVAALDDMETLSLHRDQITELRATHRLIDQLLLDAAVEEVRRLTGRLLEALYVPVDKRIPRRLLELAESYGNGAVEVTIPLTQDDIAGLAGTTRPTVNKVLRGFEDAGAVALARGSVRVLDLKALAAKAR